jgi:hypothetical protein
MYNFLDDFKRINENVTERGVKKGFEYTLSQDALRRSSAPTTQKTGTYKSPEDLIPRKLSHEEVKQFCNGSRRRAIKISPFP